MSRPRLIRTIALVALASLSIAFTGAGTAAASADQTAPTAPFLGYAQGFYCLTLIAGATRSTDNVTPQPELRYEVFDHGVLIGSLIDQGHPSGPWGVMQMTSTGPHTITVQAIDAAGNRSAPSRAVTVTGYYTPGCVPYHF